jgi:hypothetical protein
MIRHATRITRLGLALLLTIASTDLAAHHSHQRFFDWCTTATFEGRIARVEWKNPHSLIDVVTDDGVTYHVEWTSLSSLARQYGSPPPGALAPGARVVVAAHPMRSVADIRASFPEWNGNAPPNTVDPTQIRRVDNGFTWELPPSDPLPRCSGN